MDVIKEIPERVEQPEKKRKGEREGGGGGGGKEGDQI